MRDTVHWRNALASDLPRIQELWDEQEHRFVGTGVKVDRPDLSQPPTMCVRVAEKDGQVVGFYHVEAVAELSIITGDENVMRSLPREMAGLSHWLKSVGVRTGWGLVPKRVEHRDCQPAMHRDNGSAPGRCASSDVPGK